MNKILSFVLMALACFSLVAQTNTGATNKIVGTLDIQYDSRKAPGKKGIPDVYNVNVNIGNSAIFYGKILDNPQIIEGFVSKSVTQKRSLNYDISCDILNPKNLSQRRNVGRLYGPVFIDSDGTYRYDSGTLVMDILPMGNAGGSSSKFGGLVSGKPLGRPANWMETLKRETVNITRVVNGKTTTVSLKKYDKLDFRQHILAAGPIGAYQPVTLNGEMLYDYDKACWFFNNVTMQYTDNQNIKIDRLSGTIRWVESPQRKANGEGEYQFDIRVNEPPPSVSSAFEAAANSDESAFFETDTTIPALVGLIKYKDTMSPNGTTLASRVIVELNGNNINKQQLMSLAKIIFFSSVVPMNGD